MQFVYYPKWTKSGTEATISWDASGYYLYLPATFIYDDLRGLAFMPGVLEEYGPTPNLQQAFRHEESGNYVLKYSVGQAVLLAPFFLIGHATASMTDAYPADGFSVPYQLAVSTGALLYAFLGLILLRRVLLRYFRDGPVALTLLALVLGSNYLNYAAIDGAMTHNTLFTLYALLIYATIRFRERPGPARAVGIGLLVGLAALTRPTEIISLLIPLLWGADLFSVAGRKEHWAFLSGNVGYVGVAAFVTAAVGSLQIFYWHYATGEPIVYSYQEQGFSWLQPHIFEGLFSYRAGWLVYSPLMVFGLVGFAMLYRRQRSLFAAALAFSLLFMYIAFAWDVWWYGGSLGQRAMVQAYPVLAFPLCAFWAWFLGRGALVQGLVGVPAVILIYANLWFTHQAHRGGMLHVGEMNGPYFWQTLFRYDEDPEYLKLLDGATHLYRDEPANVQTVFHDPRYRAELDGERQFGPEVFLSATELPADYDWLRISAHFGIKEKEWEMWRMGQFIVKFMQGEQEQRAFWFRIQRQLNENESRRLHLDVRKPDLAFDHLRISFWNAGSDKPLTATDLKVEAFDEE